MPLVNLYIKKGCTEDEINQSLKGITGAIATTLENTKPRMVRITVTEVGENEFIQGSSSGSSCMPTVILTVGPGRSSNAINKCVREICSSLSSVLRIDTNDVRVYFTPVLGDHFSIGGKAKKFEIAK
jgi:phenylpyruvate tautomerase PptA (4-oxalocrotonate tautomerase family)